MNDRLLIHLSFAILFVLSLLIVLGGLVTASQSGLGCGPDWPICQGHLLPSGFHADVEWTHRLVAAVVGVMIVIYVVVVLRQQAPSTVRKLAFLSLVLLCIQVMLGAYTVLSDLPAWVVGLHDLTALILLESFLAAWFFLRRPRTVDRVPYPLRLLLWLCAVLGGGAVVMGSLLAHLNPACSQGAMGCVISLTRGNPATGAPAILHWAFALALGMAMSAAFVMARPYQKLRIWVGAALLLFALQATLGLLLLATGLSDGLLAFHEPIGLFLATTVFGSALTVTKTASPYGASRASSALGRP